MSILRHAMPLPFRLLSRHPMPVTFALLSTPRRYSGELSSSYFVECHSTFFLEKSPFICIYPKKVVPLQPNEQKAWCDV